jgi:3',5'-cyclic AMP phosphodiesterase CpdA
MRIAHLSDPHLTSGPLAGVPAAGLELALQRVLGLDPRPDGVVITGDLADHGRHEEYSALRDLLDGFPLPLHLAIGNHDHRGRFLEVFGGTPFLAGSDQTYYAVDHPAGRLVVLDSKDETTAAGRLDDVQLLWLDGQLDQRSDVPTVLCLHHPPVRVGIPVLDAIRLADPHELADVLARHRTPARILAGHVHRVITAHFGGTVVSIAPSTYRQVDLTMQPDRSAPYVYEPPGFLLHLLNDDVAVTHLVPASHTSAAFATV